MFTYTSSRAASCSLTSNVSLWAGANPKSVACNGSYRAHVAPTTLQQQWIVTFMATNVRGATASQSRTLIELGPPPTPTASLLLSPTSLPSSGGNIVLTYSSENASSCSLKSTPAFWTGSNPTTVACNGTYRATVSSAFSKLQWIFTFTATNAVGVSVSGSQTLTEQAPPAVTSTTVSMALSSSATNDISTSLVVDYDASLTATCSYSDGSTAPCALPDGTLSWQIDGQDAGGNVTYLSSPASNCTATVGGSTTEEGCDVTWTTYGDQWFTATYSSPSASSVAQTIEVQVR